jgi:hypothetical protein
MRPNVRRIVLELDTRIYDALRQTNPSPAFGYLSVPLKVKVVLSEWLAAHGVPLAPVVRTAGRPAGAKNGPSCPRAKKRRRKEARRSETAQPSATPSETISNL